MASGDGVGDELHSSEEYVGFGRTTEELTCCSVQMGLSIKRDVWFDNSQIQGQISCEWILTRIWRRL